jgi:hypothetical protein
MAFICIIYGTKSSITENGSTLLTLRKLQIIGLFCTNCLFTQSIFLHFFSYNVLNFHSLSWLFYSFSIQHPLLHMSNKSIPHFTINLWTFCDSMSFNFIENTDFGKSLYQPS